MDPNDVVNQILAGSAKPDPITQVQEMGEEITRLRADLADSLKTNDSLKVTLDAASSRIVILEACINNTYVATKK